MNKKEFIFAAIIVVGITIIILNIIALSDKEEGEVPDVVNPYYQEPVVDIYKDPEPILETEPPKIPEVPITKPVEGEVEVDKPKTIIEKLGELENKVELLTTSANAKIFYNMFSPTKDEITSLIGLDMSKIENYVIRLSTSKFDSKMYIVLKPNASYKEDAKKILKEYMKKYEDSWFDLNANQHDLVVNRKAVERNDFIVYIISVDNEKVLNEIRKVI